MIMALYKLLVLNWSIFTLSIQLILCASVYPNADPQTPITPITNSEIFCNLELERTLPDDGIESSLSLHLLPSARSSCKRIFRAPPTHGFFVHLHRINSTIDTSILPNYNNDSTITKKLHNTNKDFAGRRNSTRACPISVFSLEDDQLPPWRFDPCRLETSDTVDEPVRILQGRLMIIWEHEGQSPKYRLSITVLGKGETCHDKRKHSCLKFGEEPLLCISQDLICDGIRQCPTGGENYSDEDQDMCEHFRERGDNKNVQKPTIWQHLTLGIFKNIFGPMDQSSSLASSNPISYLENEHKTPPITSFSKSMKNSNVPESRPSLSGNSNQNSNSNNQININNNNNKVTTTKLNPGRKTSRGIAKYGSWGYMMLGMLMCSILLLLCGIWECIRRVQKHDVTDVFNINDARESTAQPEDSITENYQLPPYDPPPAYSSLFPLQKEFNIPVTQLPNSAPSSIFVTTMSGQGNSANSQPLSVITTTTTLPPLSQRNNSFMSTISRISSSINIGINRNSSCNSLNNATNTTSFGGISNCRCCTVITQENSNRNNSRTNNQNRESTSANSESTRNLPNSSNSGLINPSNNNRRTRTSSNNEMTNLRNINSNRNIRSVASSTNISTEPSTANNSNLTQHTNSDDGGIVIGSRIPNISNNSHTNQSDA